MTSVTKSSELELCVYGQHIIINKVDVKFPTYFSVETAYPSLRNCGRNKKEAV